MGERLTAWGFTVPGVILCVVATIAFFMGKIDWQAYMGALVASGVALVAK
jgi:hypothetical protein